MVETEWAALSICAVLKAECYGTILERREVKYIFKICDAVHGRGTLRLSEVLQT